MINPILSNVRIEFGDSFFPEAIIKKYDDFLFHKNTPFKSLRSYFYETIQNINMPGINLSTTTVQGLNNTGKNPYKGDFPHVTTNRTFPGSIPLSEMYDGNIINITFRNTILNWMYCYESMYGYYKRTRSIDDFYINITMMDSSEIPMILFKLSDCYVATMPGLEFSFNQSFSESKTFDTGFVFNKIDVEFLVPNFDLEQINL